MTSPTPRQPRDLLDDLERIADGEILDPDDDEDETPNPRRKTNPKRTRAWWDMRDLEDET